MKNLNMKRSKRLTGMVCMMLSIFLLTMPLLGMAAAQDVSGNDAPACICDTKCSVETPNQECPVCKENADACKGQAAEPNTLPCFCEKKCTKGDHNTECPTCAADMDLCTAPPAGEPAACICTVLCQEGAVNGYVVSWCVGHLIGLAAADAYDARYSKWCYEDLPIIPEKWKYTVAPDKKDQYEVLVSLMNRPDVESLVCATDAGREGELIFRLVYDHAGCTKPFERLWISSMEDSAIREGFENLRPGAEYDLLYEAALCRAKADWLVGISGTRLFSTLYRKTLNIGRVMTPTLALVVDRETAISDFKKEKFYTVVLDCGKFTAASERCENRKAADHLSAACSTQAAVVQSVEKKQKSTQPPKLYDLTSLQRDGNRLFGYTAQQVLDYAQALYEKKLLTYPRTDSNYLTEDMKDTIPALCELAASALPFSVAALSVDAPRVINNGKVSDHHALLPTKQISGADFSSLPAGERNILTLVTVRLLCAVGEKHLYEDTAVVLLCGGATFMDNVLEGMRDNLEQHQTVLGNLLQQMEDAKVEVKRPFPQEAELAEKSERLAALNVALNIGGKDKPNSRERQKHDGKTSIKRLLRRMGVESAASAAPKKDKEMEVAI